LPVMVFIHGGAFFLGDGTPEFYGPGWLIDHGIVLVTINYRLGPLGFMSTGDNVIPANLGLWDQRQALIWVQENISKFGGDPGNVTIFGESAGSMSCAYHILSPQSTGLFHKAIMESGNPFNPWCRMDKHPMHLTRQLVKAVDGPSEGTSEEILEFLKKSDMKRLFKNCTCGKILGDENVLDPSEFFPFRPIVDDFCSDPFLPDEPVNLLKSGKFNHVPVIVGFNRDEGIMIKVITEKAKPALLEKFNGNLSKFSAFMFLSRDVDEFDNMDEEVINKVLETSGVTEISKSPDTVEKLANVYGDSYFLAPNLDFSKMMASSSNCPVFQYRFSYCPPASLLDVMIPNVPKLLGRGIANSLFNWDVLRDKQNTKVGHGDELTLIFRMEKFPLRQRWSEEDFNVSSKLLKMWTNFAKQSNPTPEEDADLNFKWEPVLDGEDLYLDIGSGVPKMQLDEREAAFVAVWREEVVKKLGYGLKLPRSPTWTKTKD